MTIKNNLFLVLLLFFQVSCSGLSNSSREIASRSLETDYKWIDPQSVLFGIEYTFQDEVIVSEPGRLTMGTPYKFRKMDLMFENFLLINNLKRKTSLKKDTSFMRIKPGYVFEVPGSGEYTINMEPVTIEFNTTPKTAYQIIEAATPIFKAAEFAGLKPYVNPAAERSGMGHIHIGAHVLGENPFYKNPNLLRNMLVFYHKHPSLLYGFSEAYDIGKDSNIETFHTSKRQVAFQDAVAEFDKWYIRALKGKEEINHGLQEFLRILRVYEPERGDFFEHYRFINLEHLKIFLSKKTSPELKGKLTVEFRTFRPQKSPEHALANTKLLLDLMETLSEPGYLEPFYLIKPNRFKMFWSAGKIKSDWQLVKKMIKHENKLSDEMLEEAVFALENKKSYSIDLESFGKAKLYEAFSKKTNKGLAYELRINDLDNRMPNVSIYNRPLDFEQVDINGKSFWISYIDTKKLNILPVQLFTKPSVFKVNSQKAELNICRNSMKSFFD